MSPFTATLSVVIYPPHRCSFIDDVDMLLAGLQVKFVQVSLLNV